MRRRRPPSARRTAGAALVETALALFVLWALFAAMVEFGRMLMVSQALQLAARAGARQLALDDSLPAETPADAALARIYDPQWLVLDLDLLAACGALDEGSGEDPLDRFARERLPLLNQQLRPVMIREDVPAAADASGRARRLLRYPGALLVRTTPPTDACASELTVAIPSVEDERDGAVQRVRWLPVVEAVAGEGGADRFPLSGGGLAALRIHYPHQAVLWTAAYPEPLRVDGIGTHGDRVPVKDVVEIDASQRAGTPIAARDGLLGPWAGAQGLGEQLLLGERVRPYSRVLRGEALFPREVAGL